MAATTPIHIHIFFRDLRLDDNPGLNMALQHYRSVPSLIILPVYCFAMEAESPIHPCFSNRRYRFTVQCLVDLRNNIKAMNGELYCFDESLEHFLPILVERISATSIGWSHSPAQTNQSLASIVSSCICFEPKIPVMISKANTLNHPLVDVMMPETLCRTGLQWFNETNIGQIDISRWSKRGKTAHHCWLDGGRAVVLDQLKGISHDIKNFGCTRFEPMTIDGCAALIPYLSCGCVSAREIIQAIHSVPLSSDRNAFEQAFLSLYRQALLPCKVPVAEHHNLNNINLASLVRWCQGKTGVPLVDAAMRELIQTGHAHPVARYCAIMYCTQHLTCDATICDIWLYQISLDRPMFLKSYIPSLSWLNDYWVAARHCDPNATYIKRWIPELRPVDSTDIHRLYQTKIYRKVRNLCRQMNPNFNYGDPIA